MKEYLVEWMRSLVDKSTGRKHWKAAVFGPNGTGGIGWQQPIELPEETALVMQALVKVRQHATAEEAWMAQQRAQWRGSPQPVPVPFVQARVTQYRMQCEKFREVHLEAWRALKDVPELVDQTDVPPAVIRVLRAYRGKRAAIAEEGLPDAQVPSISRIPLYRFFFPPTGVNSSDEFSANCQG